MARTAPEVTGVGRSLHPEAVAHGRLGGDEARPARARGLSEAAVRRLVGAHVEHAWLGLLGVPAVNELRLSLALDEAAGGAVSGGSSCIRSSAVTGHDACERR